MFLRKLVPPVILVGAISLSALAIWGPITHAAAEDILAKLIRETLRREAMCQTLAAECTYERLFSERQMEIDRKGFGGRELGPKSVDLLRFRWSGSKWRVEAVQLYSSGRPTWAHYPTPPGPAPQKDGASTVRSMEISDGTRVCQWDLERPRPSGAVCRDLPSTGRVSGRFGNVLNHLLLHVNGKPLSDYLKSRDKPVVVEGIEEIEGIQCYRVVRRQPMTDKQPQYMVAVWIAPDRGYAPVKFEDRWIPSKNTKGQRYLRLCTDMQEVQPGLWLPTRTVHYIYAYDGQLPGVWRRASTVDVKAWKVNPLLEHGTFEIDLPPGTRIMDLSKLAPR